MRDRTRAMAESDSKREEDTLLRLLAPGESGGGEKTAEEEERGQVSVVERLGTDTLFGFEDMAPDDVLVVTVDEPLLLPEGVKWLAVPRPSTPLLLVPSQAIPIVPNNLEPLLYSFAPIPVTKCDQPAPAPV